MKDHLVRCDIMLKSANNKSLTFHVLSEYNKKNQRTREAKNVEDPFLLYQPFFS